MLHGPQFLRHERQGGFVNVSVRKRIRNFPRGTSGRPTMDVEMIGFCRIHERVRKAIVGGKRHDETSFESWPEVLHDFGWWVFEGDRKRAEIERAAKTCRHGKSS